MSSCANTWVTHYTTDQWLTNEWPSGRWSSTSDHWSSGKVSTITVVKRLLIELTFMLLVFSNLPSFDVFLLSKRKTETSPTCTCRDFENVKKRACTIKQIYQQVSHSLPLVLAHSPKNIKNARVYCGWPFAKQTCARKIQFLQYNVHIFAAKEKKKDTNSSSNRHSTPEVEIGIVYNSWVGTRCLHNARGAVRGVHGVPWPPHIGHVMEVKVGHQTLISFVTSALTPCLLFSSN